MNNVNDTTFLTHIFLLVKNYIDSTKLYVSYKFDGSNGNFNRSRKSFGN